MSKWNVQTGRLAFNGPIGGSLPADGQGTVGYIYITDTEGRCLLDTRGMDVWPASEKTIALISEAPKLAEALRECVTEEGAFCMVDESRNSAATCRRRLDAISEIARAALREAGIQD